MIVDTNRPHLPRRFSLAILLELPTIQPVLKLKHVLSLQRYCILVDTQLSSRMIIQLKKLNSLSLLFFSNLIRLNQVIAFSSSGSNRYIFRYD
jgi:hypothetical protein